jgi:hypothetical protein
MNSVIHHGFLSNTKSQNSFFAINAVQNIALELITYLYQ